MKYERPTLYKSDSAYGKNCKAGSSVIGGKCSPGGGPDSGGGGGGGENKCRSGGSPRKSCDSGGSLGSYGDAV